MCVLYEPYDLFWYLQKRGPQRSVDVIVSSSFMTTIIILTLMCVQVSSHSNSQLKAVVIVTLTANQKLSLRSTISLTLCVNQGTL